MRPDQVKNKKAIRTTLYTMGFILCCLGAYCVFEAEQVGKIVETPTDETRISGFILILVGFSDYLIARFLFSESDNK